MTPTNAARGTVYYELPDCAMYVADVREALACLPDASVHCVVTSIPYYALRDYGIPPSVWGGDATCPHTWGDYLPGDPRGGSGTPNGRNGHGEDYGRSAGRGAFCQQCSAWLGCLGLEPTPHEFVAHILEVFRAVRRVLRKDGTCWLNIGDSYATHASKRSGQFGSDAGDGRNDVFTRKRTPAHAFGLKEKDLMMMPARVALALQDDGWWVRSEIVWAKPAPMPEPTKDRPTKSHEMIYLLSRSQNYFFDAIAAREPAAYGRRDWKDDHFKGGDLTVHHKGTTTGGDPGAGRNMRDVWTISAEPSRDEHYAAYPSEIPRRAILAGTSERGVCSSCGAPWIRQVEPTEEYRELLGASWHDHADDLGAGMSQPKRVPVPQCETYATVGWLPSCACGTDVVPATVLDPFSGSGTTQAVARELGRRSIFIDAKEEYAEIAKRRLAKTKPVIQLHGEGSSIVSKAPKTRKEPAPSIRHNLTSSPNCGTCAHLVDAFTCRYFKDAVPEKNLFGTRTCISHKPKAEQPAPVQIALDMALA